MIKILEAAATYDDRWNITFYFVAALALLIGAFWTYMQVFVKPLKKKTVLKENIIYHNSEDLIEKNYDDKPKKSKRKKY